MTMAIPNTVSMSTAQLAAHPSATGQAPAPAEAIKAFGEPQRAADPAARSSSTNSDGTSNTSDAMRELVDVLKTTSIGLRFEIDDKTHRVITKVVDKDTGEIIRQMPNEEVLRVARAIDKLQGLFVSHAV